MTAPRPAIESVAKLPCRGCAQLVMHVEDVDTGEAIVVDPPHVEGGRIFVWSIRGHAFARRSGQPARVQPAWEEHQCPTPTVLVPPPGASLTASDPYEDKSAAEQQHGGWRS